MRTHTCEGVLVCPSDTVLSDTELSIDAVLICGMVTSRHRLQDRMLEHSYRGGKGKDRGMGQTDRQKGQRPIRASLYRPEQEEQFRKQN